MASSPSTQAHCEAQANWEANLAAIRRTQPHLCEILDGSDTGLHWLYGRDGALTGMNAEGQWWGGCSLPRRAADQLLCDVQVSGTACFLSPNHAAQVQLLLTRLKEHQAVMAIVPDPAVLAVMLHCADLSRPIQSDRLWLTASSRWADEIGRILDEHPGLPAPQQFVKTNLMEGDDSALVMETARKALRQAEQRREQKLSDIARAAGGGPPVLQQTRDTTRVCVVAPTCFRLWNDAAQMLGAILLSSRPAGIHWKHLDPDQPCSSGELAIALAARDCDALVTANFTRVELGRLVHGKTRIVTWLTGPRIPRFTPAMSHDALLLADGRWMQQALDAGWPAQRLAVARWPLNSAECKVLSAESTQLSIQHSGLSTPLGVIADTSDVTAPRRLEWTSQLPLWELIAHELRTDPFMLEDVGEYLASRMRKLGTQERGLDRRRFLAELILPAYQQGLIRLLIAAGIPLRLYGRGWAGIPEFAPAACGEINSRQELRRAAAECAMLLHVWPSPHAHAVEALGRPVLRAFGQTRETWLRRAAELAGNAQPPEPNALAEQLTVERVIAFLQ